MPTTPTFGWPYQSLSDPPDGASLGEDGFVAADATVAGISAALTAETTARTTMGKANLNNALGTLNSNSAVYVNLPGTSSFSFTKAYAAAATQIKVAMTCGSWSDLAATGHMYGLLISGVDYDVIRYTHNDASNHGTVTGFRFITGIAAGVYTVQGRIRRDLGPGGTNSIRVTTEDWLSILLEEVPV